MGIWTKFLMIATLLVCWAPPLNAFAAAIDSVYTDLAPEKCRTIEVEQDPMPSSLQRCPGIGGYRLLVADDDLRQTVTVISPDGKKHPLDLWQVITGAFSAVGNNSGVARHQGKGEDRASRSHHSGQRQRGPRKSQSSSILSRGCQDHPAEDMCD